MALNSTLPIDNDALLSLLHSDRKERQSTDLYRRLIGVNELATRMTAASDLDELRNCLRRAYEQWMPEESVCLFLSKDGRTSCEQLSEGGVLLCRGSCALNRELVERCFRSGSPLLIADTLNSPDLTPLLELEAHQPRARSLMLFPLQAADRVLGSLIIASLHPNHFTPLDYHLGLLVAAHLSSALLNALARQRLAATNAKLRAEEKKLTELNHRLRELAQTDDLTGLFNRRQLMSHLESEIARMERYGGELSCLMIDVDDFKQINDSNGHYAGDQVLRQLANLLRQSSRATDFVARYGGDEFTVLLAQTGARGAECAAEKLRRSVLDCSFAAGLRGTMTLSVSIGLAACTESDRLKADEILASADRALYKAKHAGGNKVAKADPPLGAGSRNCQMVELGLTHLAFSD